LHYIKHKRAKPSCSGYTEAVLDSGVGGEGHSPPPPNHLSFPFFTLCLANFVLLPPPKLSTGLPQAPPESYFKHVKF